MLNSKEFLKILLGIFISQVGSHFLTLTVASFVFFESGSAVKSSLVFVATFLPSIFVSAKLGSFADRSVSKKMLVAVELLSILATCLTGAALLYSAPIWLLCITLGIRSLLSMFGRSLVNKWIKMITVPDAQAQRFKLYSFSYFLSTAISGILAGVVLGKYGVDVVILIDIASFLISGAIYLSLKDIRDESNSQNSYDLATTTLSTLKEILSIPKISNAFFFVVFSQALFQGAYSALVSYLPINNFGTGIEGVGYFQLAASIGIISGFLILWFLPNFLKEVDWQFPLKSYALVLGGIASLIIAVSFASFSSSIAFFCVMNLCYEAIWLHHNANFFRSSPRSSAARFNFALTATASIVMSISTLFYATLIEVLGLRPAVLCVTSVFFIVGSLNILNSSIKLENPPHA